jgi:enoyl-CoA hydratase/carnithine racemase
VPNVEGTGAEPAVRVETADHIATVTIDRPPVNAVDPATLEALGETFRALGEDRDVRVAVLTGAGTRAFVGGADLKAIDSDRTTGRPGPQLDRGLVAREAFWAISDCAVPVIAAVNGPAIGAGLALVAVCDIILASETATFGTTEINVGLLGASAHLSLMVGRHKARELFFTGELIPAEELHRLGAIRAVVPQDRLMEEARSLAGVLARKSPIALRLAKESMNRVEFLALKDAYRIEQDYTARLLGFEDSAEARQAFLDKRDPDWKWR